MSTTTSHNITQWEFNSLSLTTKTIMPTFSLPSSNPLFSTFVTLYILILIYFPHAFLKLISSPLLISTFILLLSLLRFGASQQVLKPPARAEPGPPAEPEPASLLQEQCNLVETRPLPEPGPKPEPEKCDEGTREITHPHLHRGGEEDQEAAVEHPGRPLTEPVIRPEPKPEPFGYCGKGYLEWEFGAPLEVIYEAYEGEEEGQESRNDAFQEENYNNNMAKLMLHRYPSLSKYYPESDSDSESSSTWSLDDQEEREELIEIALDFHRSSSISNDKDMKQKLVEEVIHVDDDDDDGEDNLIEIDISPTSRNSCHGFSW